MKTYPVVYSYKKSRTRELELSLESLKNIREWNGEVYIIGHEPTVDFDYTYLPIEYKWGKSSGHKSNDEVCAYLTAADILDEFIVMADDFFVLKEWSLERQNRGTLTGHIKTRRNDSYTRQLEATKAFLLANNKSELSYEMHIPTLFKAKHVREMATIIQEQGKPLLIRSLIGNWYGIESKESVDPKNQPITDETVLYSSDDASFNYQKVKGYLT